MRIFNYRASPAISDNLHRKSSYRCLRASQNPNADILVAWVSFTCPSYVCAALTCIYSYEGGSCVQELICATSSVIDRIPNS